MKWSMSVEVIVFTAHLPRPLRDEPVSRKLNLKWSVRVEVVVFIAYLFRSLCNESLVAQHF